MAKTQEELNELKAKCETLSAKLQELSEDELKEVTGGSTSGSDVIFHSSYICPLCGQKHTFDYRFWPTVFHQDITTYSACNQTKEIYLTGGPVLSVVDTNEILYKTSYSTDGYTM